MRNLPALGLFGGVVLAGCSIDGTPPRPLEEPRATKEEEPRPVYREDEILVTLAEGAEAQLQDVLNAHGLVLKKRISFTSAPESALNRLYLLRIPQTTLVEEAVAAVTAHPLVQRAQPNYLYYMVAEPNDTYFWAQWAQNSTGDNTAYTDWHMPGPDSRTPGADMDANSARDLMEGWSLETVIVAVTDSGTTLDHPDLDDVIWTNPDEVASNGIDDDNNGYTDDVHGWDFADGDNDPTDHDGHGTHVCGAIGAEVDNQAGVAGTAGNVEILPLKIFSDDGPAATTDAIIDAIDYAAVAGAQVINASWGGGPEEQNLRDAIDSVVQNYGVLFVAAAGNEATHNETTHHYPSDYDPDNIISVAASAPWAEMADFSNYGMVSVDIAAPGDEIISTTPPPASGNALPEDIYQAAMEVEDPNNPGTFYWFPWSGTSMASPMVTGAAALLYGAGSQAFPSWPADPVQRMHLVRSRILDRAERWPSLGGLMATEGHLNLHNLFESDGTAPSPVTPQLVRTGDTWALLTWTAPGDDGSGGGRANYYDVRYRQGNSIGDWDTATRVLAVWTPKDPGTDERVRVDGLTANTQYTIGVLAADNVGNTSGVATVTTTTTTSSSTVVFSDDMETADIEWQADPPWERTEEQSHSDSHAWSDSPYGNYSGNEDASLTSPAVSTSGPATIAFWHRHALSSNDEGDVEVQVQNGGSWGAWSSILTVTGTNTTWTQETLASPVTGDAIRIRFRFTSTHNNHNDGWYIDDVVISTANPSIAIFDDTFDTTNNWSLPGAWEIDTNNGILDDSPSGSYTTYNRDSATLASPINLSGADTVEIRFDLASFDYEDGWDFLWVDYSFDDVQWRPIGLLTGEGLSGTYFAAVDETAGQAEVWFRLRSMSDYAVELAGTQFNDFQVWVTCPDTDNDGSNDCVDQCPLDPGKTEPGQCGCGNPDTDTDGDGTADCLDPCPLDNPDDSDGDTVCDSDDLCPGEDDRPDTDTDGTPDCADAPALTWLNATAGDQSVFVEWVNPDDPIETGFASTRICWSDSGCPDDPLACGASSFDGTAAAGEHDITGWVTGLNNGVSYCFTAFVLNEGGTFETTTIAARPFATGAQAKWAMDTGTAPLAPPGVYAGPLGTGAVFAVSANELHAMNPTDAGGTWPRENDFGWMPVALGSHAPDRPPIIPTTAYTGSSLVVFLGALDGHAYAVDGHNGTPLWQFDTGAEEVWGAVNGMFTAFAGAYDLVFVGTADATDNTLFAVDVATGVEAWRFDGGGGMGAIMSGAAVDYDTNRVYFTSRGTGTNPGTVWCLTAVTDAGYTFGWVTNVGDTDAAPMPVNSRLYVGTNAGEIHALDAADGADLWSAPFAASGAVQGFVWPEFSPVPRRLVFSTTSSVYSIIDEGADWGVGWSTGGTITSPSVPLLRTVAGAVYVGSSDGRLHALSTTDGSPAGSVLLGAGDSPIGSPTFDSFNEIFYVGSQAGVIYAVTAP